MHEFHHNLPFLPERMKIERAVKLFANLHDKTEYVFHMGNSIKGLKNGPVLEKVTE